MQDDTTRTAATLSITGASQLSHALFVRDRFSLPSRLTIPPLDPPVEMQSAPNVQVDAWDRWWARLLERDPLSPVEPEDALLAELFRDVEDEARWWETDHVTFENMYAPSWIGGWLAENELSSSVQILIVGVAGPWHMDAGRGRVLVAHSLYQDHDAMDELLQPLLTAFRRS